jgi:uncharacterized protein (DUF305 family)
MRSKHFAEVVAVVIVAVLGACGGGADHGESHTAKKESFNNQDVKFAQEMIPHHLQATEMAALAKDRTKNQDVLDLAADIEKAQGPEIDTMSKWLDAWGKEMPGGHHSMEDMAEGEGMMSGSQMTELADSKGKAFDRRFLSMMIEHHEGAITMAKAEQAKGKNPDAISLAKKIQGDQSREITLMRSLLNN